MSKEIPHKALLDSVMGNVNVTVYVDGKIAHNFTGVTFSGCELQKSTGMKNAPDKRERDGKYYTPPMMALIFDVGRLIFVLEDIKVAAVYNGVRFVLDNMQVDVVKY